MDKITTEGLRATPAGTFTTLKKIEQGGALQARKLSTGAIQFYWRFTFGAKTDRVPIGVYDATAPVKSLSPSRKGYSVAAAAEACRVHATVHVRAAPTGGYRAHVEAEKREHDEKRAVEAAAKAELAAAQARAEQRARYTLSALLETYVDHLEHVGRSSHRDARSIFKLHVEEAFPEIAGTPAAMVTDEQVADMQRRLVTAGKGRTANKLRSYIGAAYQCALRARTSSTLPTEFKPFQIRVNPAALTARESKFDRADKRPLSVDELRIYWSNIKHTPGKVGASLRLHLLTGGQRIAQFARIKNADVSDDTLVLFDGKGRPGSEPRKHIVPLIPAASECVAILRNENEFLLSTDDGKTSLSPTTLSGWSQDVPHRIANFQLKRVRSGIETALAAARVNKDDRGHLQSHGLTGVQAKHYDDHDYVEHKREALETLFRVLEGTDAQAPQRSTVPRSERRRRRKARMARSAPYDDLDKLVRDAPGQPSEA